MRCLSVERFSLHPSSTVSVVGSINNEKLSPVIVFNKTARVRLPWNSRTPGWIIRQIEGFAEIARRAWEWIKYSLRTVVPPRGAEAIWQRFTYVRRHCKRENTGIEITTNRWQFKLRLGNWFVFIYDISKLLYRMFGYNNMKCNNLKKIAMHVCTHVYQLSKSNTHKKRFELPYF